MTNWTIKSISWSMIKNCNSIFGLKNRVFVSSWPKNVTPKALLSAASMCAHSSIDMRNDFKCIRRDIHVARCDEGSFSLWFNWRKNLLYFEIRLLHLHSVCDKSKAQLDFCFVGLVLSSIIIFTFWLFLHWFFFLFFFLFRHVLSFARV